MATPPNKLSGFWKELKRRNVTRVLAVYIAVAFMILELVDMITEPFGLPEWSMKVAFFILLAGLIITVVVSWIYDIRSDQGIVKTERADKAKVEATPKSSNNWKIASYISFVIIVGLIFLNIFRGNQGASIDETLEKSIAVLPFHNYSGDPEQEYICLGLTEEVINNLYKINSFDRVASLRSVLGYQDTNENVNEIAEELNVNYVLECSYKKLREQYRFTVLLIEPYSDKQIWQQDYDRQSLEISGIPSDIAMQIADHLRAFLTDLEKQNVQKIPTSNQEAYDKYLLGKHYFRKGPIKRDLNIAVNYFKESIALDSDFALAYTYLAKSYLNIYWFRFDPSQDLLFQSKAAIDAAFRIDPELPEAFIALAEYYYHGFLDYSNALDHLETASEYMPDHPDCSFFKACVYRRMGNWEKAIIEFLKAYQGDPGSIWYLGDLVGTYNMMGDYQKALDYIEIMLLKFPEDAVGYRLKIYTYLLRDGNVFKARAVIKDAAIHNISEIEILSSHNFFPLLDIYSENYQNALDALSSISWEGKIDLNSYHPKNLYQAMIYDLLSRPEKAKTYFDSAKVELEAKLQELPDDPRILSSLGVVYAGLGEKEKAVRYGTEAVTLQSIEKDAVMGLFRIEELAWIYVLVGEYDAALEQIEILLNKHGSYSVPMLKLDPKWKPLWDHPNFIKLTEKYSNKGIKDYDS